MNLLTILGASCVDKKFRDSLFENPDGTAARYLFQLSWRDRQELKQATGNLTRSDEEVKNARRLKEALEQVDQACPRPPCQWSFNPDSGELA